jgi:PIN domain nuclease of toxin-antitoxin system
VSGALLDTHALLWWLLDDARLSAGARGAIADPNRLVYASVASVYEIALKAALRRLPIPGPVESWLPGQLLINGIMAFAISSAHEARAGSLPMHHRDPFDRLLIAQAQEESLVLVTADPAFARYDVETLW